MSRAMLDPDRPPTFQRHGPPSYGVRWLEANGGECDYAWDPTFGLVSINAGYPNEGGIRWRCGDHEASKVWSPGPVIIDDDLASKISKDDLLWIKHIDLHIPRRTIRRE